MKVLKMLGFFVVMLVDYMLVMVIVGFVLALLSNIVDISTFVGQCIYVVILGNIVWWGCFWPLMYASTLLEYKLGCFLGAIEALLFSCSNVQYFELGWFMIVLTLIEILAMVLPEIIRYSIIDKEQKERWEQQEREYKEKLKAEVKKEVLDEMQPKYYDVEFKK